MVYSGVINPGPREGGTSASLGLLKTRSMEGKNQPPVIERSSGERINDNLRRDRGGKRIQKLQTTSHEDSYGGC